MRILKSTTMLDMEHAVGLGGSWAEWRAGCRVPETGPKAGGWVPWSNRSPGVCLALKSQANMRWSWREKVAATKKFAARDHGFQNV